MVDLLGNRFLEMQQQMLLLGAGQQQQHPPVSMEDCPEEEDYDSAEESK